MPTNPASLDSYGVWVKDQPNGALVPSMIQALFLGFPLLSQWTYLSNVGNNYNAPKATKPAISPTRAFNTEFEDKAPAYVDNLYPLRPTGQDMAIDRSLIEGSLDAAFEAGLLFEKGVTLGQMLAYDTINGNGSSAKLKGLLELASAQARQEVVNAVYDKDMLNAGLRKCPGCTHILCNGYMADLVNDLADGTQKTVVLSDGNPKPITYNRFWKGTPIIDLGTAPAGVDGAEIDILPVDGVTNKTDIIFIRLGPLGLHGRQKNTMKVETKLAEATAFNKYYMHWTQTTCALAKPDALYVLKDVLTATP